MTTTEHPAYGTCTGCTQAKRVDKLGRIRKHTRTTTNGSMQLAVTCTGSSGPYAEYSRVEWNPRLGKFVDMPIEVDTVLHPLGDGEPQEVFVNVPAWPDVKAGHARFVKQGMSLHLSPANEDGSLFRAELRDAEGTVLTVEPEARNDGYIEGLVLKWMEALGKETAGAKGLGR